MAEINISTDGWEDMVREHRNAPHRGAPLLTWHSDFILRFHEFLKTVPDNERPARADIVAWTEVPEDLKGASGWEPDWEDLEATLQNNIGSFQSLDALANAVNRLHGFLHDAVAQVRHEPHIGDFENAPRSTYFWQIHGLIELWHLDWRRALITA